MAGVAGSSWPLICSEADWKQIYFSCSSGASQLPDEGARACLLETQTVSPWKPLSRRMVAKSCAISSLKEAFFNVT